MSKRIYIVILDRGPNLLPRRLGYCTAAFAEYKAELIAYVHRATVDRGTSNDDANVLYVDATDYYTQPKS